MRGRFGVYWACIAKVLTCFSIVREEGVWELLNYKKSSIGGAIKKKLDCQRKLESLPLSLSH